MDSQAGLILVIAECEAWSGDELKSREAVLLTLNPDFTGTDHFTEYYKVWWCTVRQAARRMYVYVVRNSQSSIWDAFRVFEFAACCAGLCRQILPNGYLVDESCTQDLTDHLEL